ncbi:transposase [Micromonospora cremea]|uniref:transposase n=1 Tax=Micromonospora cremea TaxID=709881 RepID=UPI003CC7FE06
MISPSRADSRTRFVSCCSSPPSPVSFSPSPRARSTSIAINCSSVTAPTGPAAGSCPEVISVVIWRLSLDRSISRYLYSPADGRLLQVLTDKATLAGITLRLVNERGTSSTCPACQRRVPKPRGRTLSCPHCRFSGHRDLVAAATIATRIPGGGPTTPTAVVLPEVLTHRRAGRHLPGAGRSRRDPRRPRAARGSVGPRRPAPPSGGESLAHKARIHNQPPDTRCTFVETALDPI